MSLVDAALRDQMRRVLEAEPKELNTRGAYRRKAAVIKCSGGCKAERYASTMTTRAWMCQPCRGR